MDGWMDGEWTNFLVIVRHVRRRMMMMMMMMTPSCLELSLLGIGLQFLFTV
jgi:hypothetical protein